MAAKMPKERISAPQASTTAKEADAGVSLLDEADIIEILYGFTESGARGAEQTVQFLLALNGVSAARASEYVCAVVRPESRHGLSIQRIQAGREVITEAPGFGGVACWTVIPLAKKRSEIVAEFAKALDELLRSRGSTAGIRIRDIRRVARDLMAYTLRNTPIRTLEQLLARFGLPPLTYSKIADPKTARRNAALRGRSVVQASDGTSSTSTAA